MAAMLVFKLLITIYLTLSLSNPFRGGFTARHPCRLAEFETGIRRYPDWPFVAANRHSLATSELSAWLWNTLANAPLRAAVPALKIDKSSASATLLSGLKYVIADQKEKVGLPGRNRGQPPCG
jgi:hypothetical protein